MGYSANNNTHSLSNEKDFPLTPGIPSTQGFEVDKQGLIK